LDDVLEFITSLKKLEAAKPKSEKRPPKKKG